MQNEPPRSLLHHTTTAHVFIIVIVGFLIYSNTFHVPFIFDDPSNIVNNPAIKDFSCFKTPSKIFSLSSVDTTTQYNFRTRILGYLTLALNYRINGLDVAGYHVFNLAVHLLNALLVYLLTLSTFSTPFLSNSITSNNSVDWQKEDKLIALLAALLFVSHPIQTQAVTYITQRFASLATLLYLLSLLTYIRSRLSTSDTSRYLNYAAALFSAVLAMMVKEISFTLPITIVIYEVMFFKENTRRRILLLLPVMATMLIIPLILLTIRGVTIDINAINESMKNVAAIPDLSRSAYLFTQFSVVVTYIRLLFLPVNQNLDYDYPVFNSFLAPQVILSFLLLTIFSGYACYLYYRSSSADITIKNNAKYLRIIAFGIFWFFITLSIESSIIPIADVIFEHRVYLPSVGAFIAFSMAVFVIKNKYAARIPGLSKSIVAGSIIIVLMLSFAAYKRNLVWQDETGLWEDVAKKSPKNPRAHNNLGVLYKNQERYDEAVRELQLAIRLKPDDADKYNNLGAVFLKLGFYERAIEQFKSAVKIQPNYAKAFYNLAYAYDEQGIYTNAIQEYRNAIRLNGDYAEAHSNLGLIYAKQGQFKEAINEFYESLKTKPDDHITLNNLGLIHLKQKQYQEAIKHFKSAAGLLPNNPEVHYNLGLAYFDNGNYKDAKYELQETIRLMPNHPEAVKLINIIAKRND